MFDSGYFMGVDVKHDHLYLGFTDLQRNLVDVFKKKSYKVENNNESLIELCAIINAYIKESRIPKDKILGVGINLSGRINYSKGYSYSFFNLNEEPLSKVLEYNIGLKVYLKIIRVQWPMENLAWVLFLKRRMFCF